MSLTKNVATLVTGNGLVQLIVILATPVVARLFDPSAFGISGVYAAAIIIFGVFASLRFDVNVLRSSDRSEMHNSTVLALLFAVATSILLALLIFVLDDQSWLTKRVGSFGPYLYFIPAGVMVNAAFVLLTNARVKQERFGVISRGRVMAQIAATGFTIFTGHFFGSLGIFLIIAGLLNQLIFIVSVIDVKLITTFIRARLISKRSLTGTLKENRKLVTVNTLGAVANALSWQLPIVFLGIFYSMEALGLYLVGLKLIQLPMMLVGKAVSQVYMQVASKVATDKERLRKITKDMVRKLVIIAVFPIIVSAVAAPQLFSLALGERWGQSGVYFQLSVPWVLVWFLASPLAGLNIVKEKYERDLVDNIVILALRLGGMFAGVWIGSLEASVALMSIGGAVAYAFVLQGVLSKAGVSLKWAMFLFLRFVSISVFFAWAISNTLSEAGDWAMAITAGTILIGYMVWNKERLINDIKI